MGYEPIPRLIMKLSLPLMISMLIQALYNIVDSIFVSRISETALTAVSLAFPLQNLVIAFALGTAVGVNSLLARRLGEGNNKEAMLSADNGIFLSVMTWAAFAIFGIIGTRPFLAMFTSDPELLSMSVTYCRICLILSLGIFIDITCERIMQATGDSLHPMIVQSAGAIINIILDPVFIFVFRMGVAGAAIATVIGQFCSMFLAIFYTSRNRYVKLSIKHFRVSGRIIRDIYAVGVPTIITNSVGTIMVSALNSIIIGFSATAVSVFGIYFKLQSFVFMPVFGLSAGMIPIIAYNYGAKNRKRMTATTRIGSIIALGIMGVGFAVFQLFPRELLSIFSATDHMIEIGVPALRTISYCFLSAAISISLTSTFQATGFGYAAMIVSIGRQLLVLIPTAWILGRIGGLDAVWLSFAISDVAGLLLSIAFYMHIYRKVIRKLGD